MQTFRQANPHRTGYPIVVSHAPTNRKIKGTTYVVMGARQLGRGVHLRVVQHAKWESCLAVKANSDIYVDQMWLGYGNNALEAWGLGLPVLSGAYPNILNRMRREYALPFLEVDPATVPRDEAASHGRPTCGRSGRLGAWITSTPSTLPRRSHERAIGLYDRAINLTGSPVAA